MCRTSCDIHSRCLRFIWLILLADCVMVLVKQLWSQLLWRRQSVVALLVVLLLFRWAGEGTFLLGGSWRYRIAGLFRLFRCPGLEAFAGLSRRLQSIGLLGDVATRRQDAPPKDFLDIFSCIIDYHCIMSEYDLVCILHADVQCVVFLSALNGKSCRSKHTVRHVVQEPPTRSALRAVAAAALDQSEFLQDASSGCRRCRPIQGSGLWWLGRVWSYGITIGIHIAEWEAQELLRIKKDMNLKWIWGEQVSFRFRTTFCCDFNVFMLFYVLYIYIYFIFLLFSILNKWMDVVHCPPRSPGHCTLRCSQAADWAECMVQFGDGSYDAEEARTVSCKML